MNLTWPISTVSDAARARITTARVAAAYGVPPLERTRTAAALGARLRQCLSKGGSWRFVLTVARGSLRVEVSPTPADGERPWCVTASCPEAGRGPCLRRRGG